MDSGFSPSRAKHLLVYCHPIDYSPTENLNKVRTKSTFYSRHCLCVLLVSSIVCLTTTVATAQTSAWGVVDSGVPLTFVDRGEPIVVARPESGAADWRAIRASAGWDGSSAAYTGRSLFVAVPALLEMKNQHLLQWESYLIAAHQKLGNIDVRLAGAWVQFFAEADELTDDEFIRRLFQLRQYDRGSALAVYPPVCVPLDLAVLSAAEAVVSIETSVPARRTLDMSETARVPGEVSALLEDSGESQFVEAVAHAINGASFSGRIWSRADQKAGPDSSQPGLSNADGRDLGAEPVRPGGFAPEHVAHADASGETVDAQASGSQVVPNRDTGGDDVNKPESADGDPCNSLDVALVAELGWLTRHRWNRLEPEIEAIASRGWVPSKLLWRAVVHQYLQANQEAVATIGELYAESYPESSSGIRFMSALLDLVDGSIHAEASSWPTRAQATNTTWLWVYAEHLRFRWQLEEASDLARLLLDQDAQFLGSWLTQTAIALRRGDMETVRTNLDHLSEASPPNSVYAYWTTQLAQQLQGEASEIIEE